MTSKARTTALHQLLAVKDTVKNAVNAAVTGSYHQLQREALFGGFNRSYRPFVDGAPQLPGENQIVQARAVDIVSRVQDEWVRLIDLTATIDATNMQAKADIIVDGTVIAADVPATTLLFLEKQLADQVAFWRKVPLLAPDKTWTFSDTSLTWESTPVETIRNEKTTEFVVAYAHSDKHPAQIKEVTKDIPAGVWTVVAKSGAMPAAAVASRLERLEKLVVAVKTAREEANKQPVVQVEVGQKLFDYLNQV